MSRPYAVSADRSEAGRGPVAPTHADRLGALVAERIVSGTLRPGQRLDEAMLATEFGVSRTPVREALRQLVATGLVELRPHRGAVVACPDADALSDSFEMLAELEALCARWSALRMTPRERAGLEALHRDMGALVRAGDRAGYRDANLALHGLVYAGAHNSHLAEVVVGTTRRLGPFRGAQFDGPERLARSHAEHDAVITCISRGDAEGAAVGMRRHIRFSGQSWQTLADHRAKRS